jgi:hypothetical protein
LSASAPERVRAAPGRVQSWLEEEYPQIKAFTPATRTEIFFVDETGCGRSARRDDVGRPPGQTPMVRVARWRQHDNTDDCLRGKLRVMIVDGKVNARRFWELLKRMLGAPELPHLDGGPYGASRRPPHRIRGGEAGQAEPLRPTAVPARTHAGRFGRERSEHHSIGRARPPEAARAEAHRLVAFAHAAADARLRAARSPKRADRRHSIMSASLRTDK